MAAPLVSIVIPVYNQRLDFFKEALTSALQQTYTNLEIVVSNNHSTNEVPAYLSTLKDPRIRVVKPKTFLPMAVHFQFVADQAQGDYIFILCSDDWMYPTVIETLTNPLVSNPQASAAYCKIENADYTDLNKVRLYPTKKRTGLRSAAESLNEFLNARPANGCIPGTIMKRSAYQQIRHLLNGDISYAFDVALLFKLHELGDIIYINEPLVKFRIWTAKDGKLGGARLLENIADLGKCCKLLEESPKLISYLHNGLQDVKEWRAYQAKQWIRSLFLGVITGTIDSATCHKGIIAISKHLSPNPVGASALSMLIAKPQIFLAKPSLNLLYKFYMSIQYRVKNGL